MTSKTIMRSATLGGSTSLLALVAAGLFASAAAAQTQQAPSSDAPANVGPAPAAGGEPVVGGGPVANATTPPTTQADNGSNQGGSGGEIVVTGSRIARKDYESNSPIVTAGAALLQNSASTAVETNLNKLPEFTAEKTPSCTTCGGDIQATPTNSPGSATVSLRGLGSNRNLVLIDGRRATPANASLAVDINTIPSAAIERVEIISGGASSTYGADAVGGVVNFILKKNVTGLQLDGQIGESQRGDGREYRLSGILGTDFADGRGNISMALETSDRNPAFRIDRPWYRKQFANPNVNGDYFFPVYSGITQTLAGPNYQAALNNLFPNRAPGTNVSGTATLYFLGNTPFTFGGQNSAALTGTSNFPTNLIDGVITKRDIYGGLSQNFPADYLDLPLKRFNFYTRGSYEVTDWLNVFGQGYFNESKTATVQQPGPIVGGWNVVIPRYQNTVVNGVTYNDSSWLPSNLVTLLNARQNPDGSSAASAPWSVTGYIPGLGNRVVTTDVYTYNIIAGVEGKVPGSDWTFDITGNQGVSVTNAVTTGVASLSRLRTVMSAPNFGAGFSQTGNAIGGGFGASSATCTTGLNPFNGATPSADCIAAVNADLKESGTMQQSIAEANAQGTLVDLWAGPLKVSVGAQYRRNKYAFLEDTLKTQGESFQDQALGIYPAKNVRAVTNSKEVYGEFSLPVLKDLPFIKLLELDGGIRYSDSNITGGTVTYKGEVNWEATNWLRIRGTYNKAERAPNLGELYSFTQNFAAINGGDACSTGNPYAYSANPSVNANAAQVLALCKQLMDKTNIPGQPANSVAFYGNGLAPTAPGYIAPSAGSVSTSTAPATAFPYFIGNPSLKPEDAKTFTIGGVLSSPFEGVLVRRLRMSVDYYNIKIKDAIGLLSGQTTQQLCLDKAFNPTYDPNSFYCNNFQRGTGGAIGAIQLAYTNSAAVKTAGVDVQLDWAIPLKETVGIPGNFSVNSVLNYLITFKTSPFYSGVPAGSRQPFTEYADSLLTPDAGVSSYGQYRWKLFTTFTYSLPGFSVGLQWQHLPHINSGSNLTGDPKYDVFSLNTSYALTRMLTLRFGVDNLFDKSPPFGQVNPTPIVAAAQLPGGTINANNYDVIGRRFYFGINAKF